MHVMSRSKVDSCSFKDHFPPSSLSFIIACLDSQLPPGTSCLYSLGAEVRSRLLHPLSVYLGSDTKFMMLSPLVWMEG